jgi:hypothetical protein
VLSALGPSLVKQGSIFVRERREKKPHTGDDGASESAAVFGVVCDDVSGHSIFEFRERDRKVKHEKHSVEYHSLPPTTGRV